MGERYLRRDGKPIHLTGLNYWPRRTGIYMWSDWRPAEIASELRQMREMSVNVFSRHRASLQRR